MGKVDLDIRSFFNRIIKNDIVKVFSLTSISTIVRMLTGFISVKVVASIIGPVGIALVGQLNNFSSIVMAISSGGINNGITKYISEYKNDDFKIKSYISTALHITFICSFFIGILLIIFNKQLSILILKNASYWYVFLIFGFTVVLYAVNGLLNSIINGFQEFNLYVKTSIANTLLGFCFTLVSVLSFGLPGALVSSVTYQSVMFFITLWLVRKSGWARWEYFKERFNKKVSSQYFKYSLMALTTAATLPISQLLLRSYVISEISPTEAGWWEAMNRLSSMYLMVITSSFSVYYMPKLSQTTSMHELKNEVIKAYKFIIPILVIGLSLVYFFRHLIIKILYTPEFLPMENLFIWQLLGDFFKISSWLLAFIMVAKSMTKRFVATEIIFSTTFIILGFLLMVFNGVVGITQAYMINYILYFICMIFLFRKTMYAKYTTD